ncbi:alpha/beta hydrolase [Acuticoccus kandeliae]|uniref:alpha/beta hydrolase n=1 Tax=Acuticoccus kandeliae TaxID=2073160 RepID=UPI000D3ED6B5|nr:alpha/beta hydrolase [Acuticoccus kandeliae]
MAGPTQSGRLRWLRRTILTVAVLAALWFGSGWLYAFNAERTHTHHNPFNAEGVILKAEPQRVKRGSDTLVVLIHGFGASPMTMLPLGAAFESATNFDLWLPLLAQHGRSLREYRAFAPEAIRDDFLNQLDAETSGYQRIVLIGHSFGGAILLDLLAEGRLPQNASVILYAPAVYLPADTQKNRLALEAFRLWSPYCDFAEIGCLVPNPRATDGPVRAAIFAQNIFFYIVPDTALRLFDYAKGLAARAPAVAAPINIVMARDDGDVAFAGTAEMCAAMAGCRMHALATGSHLAQYGPSLAPLSQILMRLAEDPAAACEADCETL